MYSFKRSLFFNQQEEAHAPEHKTDCFLNPIIKMVHDLEDFYNGPLRWACFHQIKRVTIYFDAIQVSILHDRPYTVKNNL